MSRNSYIHNTQSKALVLLLLTLEQGKGHCFLKGMTHELSHQQAEPGICQWEEKNMKNSP